MCLSVDPPEVYDVAVGTGHREGSRRRNVESVAPSPRGWLPGLSAIRHSS
jgi:hypothetical protein